MRGDPVPEHDTIARYCRAGSLSEITGKPTGASFQLRPRDFESENPHISVNWLEFFGNLSREDQIEEIRNILSQKMKVGGTAKLALLNIKAIYDHLVSSGYAAR